MPERPKKPTRPSVPSPDIDADKCIACGDCIAFCPGDVIEAETGTGKAVVRTTRTCPPGCRTCARLCPTGAVTFADEEVFIAYLKERLERIGGNFPLMERSSVARPSPLPEETPLD